MKEPIRVPPLDRRRAILEALLDRRAHTTEELVKVAKRVDDDGAFADLAGLIVYRDLRTLARQEPPLVRETVARKWMLTAAGRRAIGARALGALVAKGG